MNKDIAMMGESQYSPRKYAETCWDEADIEE